MIYKYRKFYIPETMMEEIQRYIKDGVPPSSFLSQIVQNNLMEACARADEVNFNNIQAYAAFFYNESPSQCWGSKEIMDDWIVAREKERGER